MSYVHGSAEGRIEARPGGGKCVFTRPQGIEFENLSQEACGIGLANRLASPPGRSVTRPGMQIGVGCHAAPKRRQRVCRWSSAPRGVPHSSRSEGWRTNGFPKRLRLVNQSPTPRVGGHPPRAPPCLPGGSAVDVCICHAPPDRRPHSRQSHPPSMPGRHRRKERDRPQVVGGTDRVKESKNRTV